nr:unnamed protein product [Callosobruchus chinensis]
MLDKETAVEVETTVEGIEEEEGEVSSMEALGKKVEEVVASLVEALEEMEEDLEILSAICLEGLEETSVEHLEEKKKVVVLVEVQIEEEEGEVDLVEEVILIFHIIFKNSVTIIFWLGRGNGFGGASGGFGGSGGFEGNGE